MPRLRPCRRLRKVNRKLTKWIGSYSFRCRPLRARAAYQRRALRRRIAYDACNDAAHIVDATRWNGLGKVANGVNNRTLNGWVEFLSPEYNRRELGHVKFLFHFMPSN